MPPAVANSNQLVKSPATPAGTQMIFAKLQAFWASRNTTQRMYLGVGLGVVVAAIAFFAHMIATPDMKPLMTGLESADAQAMGSQLAAKKIPYTISPDGTSISVPADQVDAARMEVASHDSPHSGRIGFEIFDKVSWGETEFDEKVNYQRALEGELERTIQTMSNVKSARVHLVMATDSIFIDRERPAKSSVTLRLRRGSLSREETAAIQRLVAGAVDDLKPGDVALVDADSNKSLSPSGSDSNDEAEQALSRRLVATLAPIVGADGIHATVNVEYDNSSSEESQEKYDPASAVPLTMQKSAEGTGAGSAIGGVPGTSSNVPSAKSSQTSTASTDPGASSTSESATYGVNRTMRRVVSPAGRIRRVTAAVVVDDAIDRHQEKGKWVETRHKRSPEEIKLITELSQAAIGYDSTRGDVISVQNLTFNHTEADDIAPTTWVDKARKGVNDYSSIIRYGALFGMFMLVYLLMIRPIQKKVLATSPQAALTGEMMDTPALPNSPEDLAARSLALKKQLTEFVRKEPETSTTAVRAWLREGV